MQGCSTLMQNSRRDKTGSLSGTNRKRRNIGSAFFCFHVYGFTLPLGNACGTNGFALFVGLCCVFASNLYGFELTIGRIFQFVFLGIILSVGSGNVKGAGIVMSVVLMEALGMPLSLIPILAAIWPTIDPAHTVLNNAGDIAGTVIVANRLGMMDTDVFNDPNK